MSLSESRAYLFLGSEQEQYCQPGLHYRNADRELRAFLRARGCEKAVFLEGSDRSYTLITYDAESFGSVASYLKSGWGKTPEYKPVKGRDVRTLESETARKVVQKLLGADRKTALIAEAESYAELASAALPEGKAVLVIRSGENAGELRRLLLNSPALRSLWSCLDTPAPEDLFSVLRRELGDRFLDGNTLTEKEPETMLASAMLRSDYITTEEQRRDMAAVLYFSYYSERLAERTLLRLQGETPRKELKKRLEKQEFLARLERIAETLREGAPEGSLREKLRAEYPVVAECERREENSVTRLLDDRELRKAVPMESHARLDELRAFYATPWNRPLSVAAEKNLTDALGYLREMYAHDQRENADKLFSVLLDNAGDSAILDNLDDMANALSLYAQADYQVSVWEENEARTEKTVEEKRRKKEECDRYIQEMGINDNTVRRWKMYQDAEKLGEAQLRRLRDEKQEFCDVREALESGLIQFRISRKSFSSQQLEKYTAEIDRIMQQQSAQLSAMTALSAENAALPEGGEETNRARDAYYEEHPEVLQKNIRRMKQFI